MKIFIIVCVLLAAVVIAACCKVSGECSQEEDHCDTCLRWSECNGVDENCPWRAE